MLFIVINERPRPFYIFLFINLIDIVDFILRNCNLFIEILFLELKIILEMYLLTCLF